MTMDKNELEKKIACLLSRIDKKTLRILLDMLERVTPELALMLVELVQDFTKEDLERLHKIDIRTLHTLLKKLKALRLEELEDLFLHQPEASSDWQPSSHRDLDFSNRGPVATKPGFQDEKHKKYCEGVLEVYKGLIIHMSPVTASIRGLPENIGQLGKDADGDVMSGPASGQGQMSQEAQAQAMEAWNCAQHNRVVVDAQIAAFFGPNTLEHLRKFIATMDEQATKD